MLPITLLTGPAASGKNTIAQLYATRFCDRCAVIDGDTVRWMLRQPHVAPWDGNEGLRQHRLGVRHACALAQSFIAEQCEVVLLDVLWADLPQIYRTTLRGYSFRIVRLMPSWEESLHRLQQRPPSINTAEARWVYDTQVTLTDFDHSIDNTSHTADETAAMVNGLIRV